MNRVAVVGAGVGGLTTAAVLAKAGVDVTVLEAHIYPGGCAGSFYYQGYHFDAGATLAAGFYPGGPMEIVAQAAGIERWDTRPSVPAMMVHLPDGTQVSLESDERRWLSRRSQFGAAGESFFQWQETRAEALWDLTLRGIPWPPQSPAEAWQLVSQGLAWLRAHPGTRLTPGFLLDAIRPVQTHLQNADENLKLLIDAQLLISAQTTSEYANALYAAAALDLPRRGAALLAGGMGAIGTRLAQAVEDNGGQVRYRKRVQHVHQQSDGVVSIELQRGESISADVVIFNLTPWNIASLLGEPLPRSLRRLPARPKGGWGAFMMYVGIDQAAIPAGFPVHHQILRGRPLGEGNSIFLSINPEWDTGRAPSGKRAITISTHTALSEWWQLYEEDLEGYTQRRASLQEKMLSTAEIVLPALRDHIDLILDGTPITFERFTGRAFGWVGGFPQTNLFQSFAPRLSDNLWMVGDSIFPGQSTAAVALGGLRVAGSILRALKLDLKLNPTIE
ncbi:MAG: FAD-dependent oxidoreductase [Anaerolineales bacterium]|nr:MAG: FAD-dependent oxidoreductase [Anaerolineales bacterium]